MRKSLFLMVAILSSYASAQDCDMHCELQCWPDWWPPYGYVSECMVTCVATHCWEPDPGENPDGGNGSGPDEPETVPDIPEVTVFPTSPFDLNGDGYIDCWKEVIPSWTGNINDIALDQRLGTRYGGENTERPAHRGVDIAVPAGSRVTSLSAGSVEAVGYHSEMGNYVKISDQDTGESFWYMHLRDLPTLAEGDIVMPGDEVGRVGSTGRSTGNHLHLSYGMDGTKITRKDFTTYSNLGGRDC